MASVIRAYVLGHRTIDLRDVMLEPLVQEDDDGLDRGQRAVGVLRDQVLGRKIELAVLGEMGLDRLCGIPFALHELLFHLEVDEDVVGQLVERLRDAGPVRPVACEFKPIDPGVATWTLLGIMYPYFYPARAGNGNLPDETIRQIIRVYLGGITK